MPGEKANSCGLYGRGRCRFQLEVVMQGERVSCVVRRNFSAPRPTVGLHGRALPPFGVVDDAVVEPRGFVPGADANSSGSAPIGMVCRARRMPSGYEQPAFAAGSRIWRVDRVLLRYARE